MSRYRYAQYMETPENTVDDLLGLTGHYKHACDRMRGFSETTRQRVFRIEDTLGKQSTRRFQAGRELLVN